MHYKIDKLYRNLKSCIGVTNALLIRDVKDKIFEFGALNLVSPVLIQLAIQLALFFIFKKKTIMGMDTVIFILSGYLPYLLFERILLENSMVFIMMKNTLAIKQVKIFNAILANCICWFLICVLLFIVSLMVVGIIFEIKFQIYYLGNIVASFILIFFMSLGLSMIAAVLGIFIKYPVMLVLGFAKIFYLSGGIFFPIDSVPYGIRSYLLLNPLLHIFELDRYAFVSTHVRDSVNFEYPFLWAIILLFVGFAVYLNFKDEFLRKAFE